MADSQCNRCTKHTIILLSSLSMLNGLIMLIGGSISSEASIDHPPGIGRRSIIMAVILILIPPIGIYGILQKKWAVIISFALVFVMCFIITVSLGINLVSSTNKYESYYTDSLLSKYKESKKNQVGMREMYRIHRKYRCCGIKGPFDDVVILERILSSDKTRYIHRIYQSCCEMVRVDCYRSSRDVFQIGCMALMNKEATSVAGLVGIYVIVSSLLFLYIAIFFLTLSWQMKYAEAPPPELEEYEEEDEDE